MCAQRRFRSAWVSTQSDQSSLSAWKKAWVLSYPFSTHLAHSVDSDQTGQMPRLIWVITGCTVILLVFSRGGSNYFMLGLHKLCGWAGARTHDHWICNQTRCNLVINSQHDAEKWHYCNIFWCFVVVVCSGLTSLSTIFLSYHDGVRLRQEAQCSLL